MEQYRAKIEEHAGLLEKMGTSPVGARIYIYLFFAPDYQATFEDLTNYFNVSKSAISNGLKYLENTGLVVSKTMNGQRKRYFKMNIEANTGFDHTVTKLQQMVMMVEDIVATRKDEDNLELDHLASFYRMMLVEYPVLLEKWKKSMTK